MSVHSVLGWSCATLLAAGGTLVAQTPTTGQQQKTPQQQTGGQQPSQSQSRSASMTGCVFQLSDDPSMYALNVINEPTATGTSGQSGTTQNRSDTAGTTGKTGATGTAGATGGAAAGTTNASQQNLAGTWYRLSGSQSDLKQYVGKAVRVSGNLVPGKDEKGADVVIHRIEPQKLTVTALDLRPAPHLSVQSITQAQGQCPGGAQNR